MNTTAPHPTTGIIDASRWRYAVKLFDKDRALPPDVVLQLKQAVVLAPSSYGLQPWKAIFITDPELRQRLTPASFNQPQVASASHFVVFAAKTGIDEAYIQRFIAMTAAARGIPAESLAPYEKMMVGDLIQGPRSKAVEVWSARQAYIALGVLLTAAAEMRVDACPMEGFDPAKYDEILGLSGSGYRAVVAAALGYRSPKDAYQHLAKVRFPEAEVIETR